MSSFRSYQPTLHNFPKAASKTTEISSTYEPIFEAILLKKPLTMWSHHVNLPSLRTQFNRWRRKLPVDMQFLDYTVDAIPVEAEPGKVALVLRPKKKPTQLEYFIGEPGTAKEDSQHENILPILDADT